MLCLIKHQTVIFLHTKFPILFQERLVAEEAAANEDKEMDYLAPFLQQINNPQVLTPSQAFKLKEECLADLKQRLIDKANLIQQRFEKVCCG